MLRNPKSASRLGILFILTSLSATENWVAAPSDDVPAGYEAGRYQQIWERNPFTIVTPVAQAVQPKVFDKLVLLSWLNDGGNDVVFVQNTETNEVQKITKDPNVNRLRLVAIHKAADPKDADVVLSNGPEEGSVKFRLETVTAAIPQSEGGKQQAEPTAGVPNPLPGGPTQTFLGLTRKAQAAAIAQQATRLGAEPATPQKQADEPGLPPRASEVRRKRIMPPPVVEQPVDVPSPAQNVPGQPQTQ